MGNQAVYGKQRIDRGSARLYRKVDQHLKANSTSQNAQSKQLKEIYRAEIGVKEATGNNDGSRVGEYLRYCGLGEGYAWCAAFVSWCHWQAGYPEPRNAWAATLLPTARRVNDPRPGDVFGIYYTNLKRIAHVGFVDEWDDQYCITVEGNTGPPTDHAITDDYAANPIRAGPARDGVYRKRRPIRTIHAVARWTK
ncbi:CHAP domain-containing protein [Parapedobacter soli]|uniref:CHAP domain-containing protein n=1 Tax=Parapedobacter soli TaxID=416955 RepID=UPI0021CA4032|nr:CHAP domain-containing protein [Parapedobacter soli]